MQHNCDAGKSDADDSDAAGSDVANAVVQVQREALQVRSKCSTCEFHERATSKPFLIGWLAIQIHNPNCYEFRLPNDGEFPSFSVNIMLILLLITSKSEEHRLFQIVSFRWTTINFKNNLNCSNYGRVVVSWCSSDSTKSIVVRHWKLLDQIRLITIINLVNLF